MPFQYNGVGCDRGTLPVAAKGPDGCSSNLGPRLLLPYERRGSVPPSRSRAWKTRCPRSRRQAGDTASRVKTQRPRPRRARPPRGRPGAADRRGRSTAASPTPQVHRADNRRGREPSRAVARDACAGPASSGHTRGRDRDHQAGTPRRARHRCAGETRHGVPLRASRRLERERATDTVNARPTWEVDPWNLGCWSGRYPINMGLSTPRQPRRKPMNMW